jgi:aminoglycoside 6'-N-acetyltransferase I
MFTYKKATTNDLKIVIDIAIRLYTDHIYEDNYEEIADLLCKDSESIWLCYTDDIPIAFAHASLRFDYVEGTNGGTIGYLEGIYVSPEYRNKSIARELVVICEN